MPALGFVLPVQPCTGPSIGACRGRAIRRISDGFTLLEVLIALVIAVIALDVLSGGISSALRSAHTTSGWDRAVSRAESHLAEITDPGLALGERQGDEANGYHWRTHIAFLGSALAPDSARGGAWAHGTALYALSVTITWREGAQEQHFELQTARLGPIHGAGS